MNIGFIGAGKVGFSLGRYFAENGVSVTGYFSSHVQSATEAAKFTGSQVFYELSDIVRESDTIFLTLPDVAVRELYGKIREMDIKGKCLCHCSCAMSAEDAFPDMRELGASGYSIHPLFPISSKYETFKELHSAFFSIEGSEDRIDEWVSLFNRLGNGIKVIPGNMKSRYHAGCIMASNLVSALAVQSLKMMKECGFSETEALKAFTPLIMSNVKRILAAGPEEAVAGPVERNELEIVRRHIECMDDDIDRNMYKAVSRKLADIVQKKHPETDYSEMARLLNY
ncbi:Rossmann-like and DUF2520 domain-containing protein [Ruminococcus sp.]|uniref:Rossmann-like and DUF2520 domain-containing protein n=1 Tax=Ruminococcus sp. TaxID=41978 RepID=UPI0025FDC3AB|nr:Rossmann-like and DUF2520 domain-containing protein [Ruminococcus sp.]